MAYVVPSGVIQLMKGVHLDNRYAHTIYFANKTDQYNWFTTMVTNTFDAQSYTRHNADTVKLKINCDAVADCTYMRFQNRPNGKWYYCFINYVNYINENTTEIIFEIDVMQTWFFQTGHKIKPCFVDREHVSADTFGIYHAPDTPSTDEYSYNWIKDSSCFSDYSVVVDIGTEPSSIQEFQNNSYHGCRTLVYVENAANAPTITQEIKTALGGSWDKNEQSANMIDMYAFPTAFATGDVLYNVHDVNLSRPTSFTYDDGTTYTPKNKKLMSNPYCMLVVSDFCGTTASYEWEQFTNPANITFTLRGNRNGGGSIIAYPSNYGGLTNNFDAGIMLNNFPKRAFSYDAYSAWVAGGGMTRLNEQKNIVKMQGMARTYETVADMMGVSKSAIDAATATGAAMATGGLATPVAAHMAASAGQQIAQASANTLNRQIAQREAQNNIEYTFKDAKYAPDIVFGQISPDIAVSHRILEVNFINMFPKLDEAKRIDDFFSTYGYSIKEVKTPNLTGRKYWNFLKTKGCMIGGNMPSSSRQAISEIIDSGIFFWHLQANDDGSDIGNFRRETSHGTIDNPII